MDFHPENSNTVEYHLEELSHDGWHLHCIFRSFSDALARMRQYQDDMDARVDFDPNIYNWRVVEVVTNTTRIVVA